MNEVTRIHLGRQPYTISVAAHKELKDYLAAIEKQVGDKDVLQEVELRMSELLSERGVDGRQGVECFGQALEIGGGVLLDRCVEVARQRDLECPTAALGGAGIAHVVDDDTPHRARRVTDEPRPIRKLGAGTAADVEVRLVDERRGAQRNGAAVAMELPLGDAVQLVVERGEQLGGGSSTLVLDFGGAQEVGQLLALHRRRVRFSPIPSRGKCAGTKVSWKRRRADRCRARRRQ